MLIVGQGTASAKAKLQRLYRALHAVGPNSDGFKQFVGAHGIVNPLGVGFCEVIQEQDHRSPLGWSARKRAVVVWPVAAKVAEELAPVPLKRLSRFSHGESRQGRQVVSEAFRRNIADRVPSNISHIFDGQAGNVA